MKLMMVTDFRSQHSNPPSPVQYMPQLAASPIQSSHPECLQHYNEKTLFQQRALAHVTALLELLTSRVRRALLGYSPLDTISHVRDLL